MRFEIINISHYPIVEGWWKDWGWQPVIPSMLSRDGIMVYNDQNKPIYAGWIYFTGTDLAFFEFIVSNKQATKEEKKGGLDYLLQTADTIIKYKGANKIWHQTNNEALIKGLVRNGFQKGDLNCTNLCKNII